MTLEELMDQHGHQVRGRVRQLVHANDVEDVLQTIWLKVWRHLHTFRADAAPSVWLYRIATNAAFDHHRARVRRPVGAMELSTETDEDTLPFQFVSTEQTPEQLLQSQQTCNTIAQHIDLLPRKYRAVLTIHLQGYSNQDIAKQLGVSEGTVKSRLHRGRELLRSPGKSRQRLQAKSA